MVTRWKIKSARQSGRFFSWRKNLNEIEKKKIVDGITLLYNECKQIPQEKCHSMCPYENICRTIRCVGWEANTVHRTPDMWDMKMLEGEEL